MDAVRSQILIKYSHYTEKFEARDGVVRWADIDASYCISAVFGGKPSRRVRRLNGEWFAEEAKEDKLIADYFLGFDPTPGIEYLLVVEEDPKHRSGSAPKAYRANSREKSVVLGKGNGTASANQQSLLTSELKAMTSEQLKEGGEEYKKLIEARDLEEVLFSG
jgi:hypothetical protein